MAAALLPDPLWDLVEPFLPTPGRQPKGGRLRVSDRACFTGTLFVLRSGIPWQMLPPELGCGSGMTCRRRLRDWQRAGVWDLIHFALLDWLARHDQIDWSRAVVDRRSSQIAVDAGKIASLPKSGASVGLGRGSVYPSASHRSTPARAAAPPIRSTALIARHRYSR